MSDGTVQERKYADMTESEREEIALKKCALSRHKNRPSIWDYIPRIFEGFTEMHGDRAYADDRALITGLALFEGRPVTVIGHVRGRNTKENIESNFSMPHPEGYRKALRQMKLADKFERPVITFVDTSGAYPGAEAEERGQGEAIARNLYEMSRLRVPVITVFTGQGSSGGALGIAQSNCVMMMENATYSVISAKGFASILWRDATRENEAAVRQRMTAEDLLELGVIERIIPEPGEGAHTDCAAAATAIKEAISEEMKRFTKMTPEEIYRQRYAKFRAIGFFNEM